jgi:putative peptidoglycan lipid II flippase
MSPREADDSDAQEGLVQATGAVGLATLLSRVLGFIRDVVMARAFGAGLTTDAFFVAFRIPNLLRRLLAEGALSTAFVPVFTNYLVTQPRAEVARMIRSVAAALLLSLCAVSLLGILLAQWIVTLMAPGFSAVPQKADLAVRLTRLMFPYLLFVGLAALAMGVLNAHRRFFAPALGPVALNVSMIAAVLFLAPRLDPPINGLAIGVLVGGLGQFLIQIPALRRVGVSLVPSSELSHPALARIAALLGPSVVALAALQLNVFVNTLLASLLPEGSISYLYYADRVMEFPLGVFGIAVATAALPPMAEQAARQDWARLTATLNFALRLSCFVAVPASVGLLLLRTPIVRVLFERGEFRSPDTLATAWALGFYALGLTAFASVRIVAQTFYALGDVKTPVRAGALSVLLNVVFALILMWPLAHGGLALASSCASAFNVWYLLRRLRRRLGPLGGRRILESLGRIGAGSGCLLVWCGLALWLWPDSPSRLVDALWLAAAIGGGATVYGAGAAALRCEEAAALFSLIRRGSGTLRRGKGSWYNP